MKKLFLLGILVLLTTGCTSIKESNLEDLIDNALFSKVNIQNTNRNGYSYYLPKGISVKNNMSYNEVFTDQNYTYYLYVDIVSYSNKVTFTYKENANAYYSKSLMNGIKKGYIEINKYTNEQYLIEIMYNYAKIEVIVYEEDINKSITYAMSILSSITYNDNVITSNLANNDFSISEEEFDIFKIVGSNNYLEFTSEEKEEDKIKDPDYVG